MSYLTPLMYAKINQFLEIPCAQFIIPTKIQEDWVTDVLVNMI